MKTYSFNAPNRCRQRGMAHPVPLRGSRREPAVAQLLVVGHSMSTVAILAMLAVTFFCGCATQKDLQTQFVKVSDDYYIRYCHAQSREAAISELKDYLVALDSIQKPWATKVRYNKGRSLAEARLSLIYDQLGDNQNAQIFMKQGLRDIQQDHYSKDVTEPGLKQMVETIDSLNSIVWQKTKNHDVISTH